MSMTSPTRHHAAIAAAALLLTSACSSDTEPDASSGTEPLDGRPMIVDYSPTLSDVPALMFLATHPDIDLLAVTLPGTGESDCAPGVRHTRALLTIAGNPETPVGCGRDEPMEGDRDWPQEWRTAANTVAGVLLPGVPAQDPIDAEDLLARTLRDAKQPVSIVTLGPLTNLGLVLGDDPALADQIESVVAMAGAFEVDGNVDSSPAAEWNMYIDPAAMREVLASGVDVTFVGLDATNSVPGNSTVYARLVDTVGTDSGEAVKQMWAAGLDTITSDGWYLWDELAAVVAMDPTVATIEDHNVAVLDDGSTVIDDDGVPARVATSADPAAFAQTFLTVFAGGELPDPEPLTADELVYIDTITAAMTAFGAAIDEIFASVESQEGEASAGEVLEEFAVSLYSAVRTIDETLAAVVPPAGFADHHDALAEPITKIHESEDDFMAYVSADAPSGPFENEMFWEMFIGSAEAAGITTAFEDFEQACGELELATLARGHDSPFCSLD